MTTVSIGQVSYLPWTGLFDRIAKSDIFIALDHVSLSGGETKNKILTPNGIQELIVPIKSGQSKTPIADIEIADDAHWRRKHSMAIQQNYSHAPYYYRHGQFFEDLYKKQWQSLCGLSLAIMDDILYQWDIKTPIIRSTDMMSRGQKSQLNLNLCNEVGADKFLVGVGTYAFLDKKMFADAGIEIVLHDYAKAHPVYLQNQEGAFVPCLSAVDALMNCEGMPG